MQQYKLDNLQILCIFSAEVFSNYRHREILPGCQPHPGDIVEAGPLAVGLVIHQDCSISLSKAFQSWKITQNVSWSNLCLKHGLFGKLDFSENIKFKMRIIYGSQIEHTFRAYFYSILFRELCQSKRKAIESHGVLNYSNKS